MKVNLPMPVVVAVCAVAVIALGIFLFKGATGGVQGDGQMKVQGSPPMPASLQHNMSQGRIPGEP